METLDHYIIEYVWHQDQAVIQITLAHSFMNACRLPKVELHAHLSGSISNRTLLHLIDQKKKHGNFEISSQTLQLLTLEAGHSRTLEECFQIFPIIHSVVDSEGSLRYAVRCVLADFQEDNVVYLELRTTPRQIHVSGTVSISRRRWVEIILSEIEAFHTKNRDGMICRLILSIDRSKPLEDAESVRQLVSELVSHLIVGVELSGNPIKGDWSNFEPVFSSIRSECKLPISLHFGELLNENEALQMLEFKPHRLGHAICLTEKTRDILLQSRIPLEICLTSNHITKSIPRDIMQNHPVFTTYHPKNHPFTLCTDDMGIFRSSLSDEWSIFLNYAQMSPEEYARHFLASLKQSFCKDEDVLNRLRKKVDAWLKDEIEFTNKSNER